MEQQETEEVVGAERIGLLCFLNDTRECNASCMAWLTSPANYGPELNEQQSHCALITGIERMSRHITIIARQVVESDKKNRIAEADKQREKAMHSPITPNPFPLPQKKT